MKNLLTCLLIMTSLNALTAQLYESRARFLSKRSDGFSFVKKQLLYEGYREIITKAMKDYGLDGKAFWARFDERLNTALSSLEEELRNKKKDEDYIRVRKLELRRSFGSLFRLIQSYSVKSFTRSSSNPNYRFLTLEARVNANNLSKLYKEYMGGGQSSVVEKLFVHVDFSNKFFNYSQIGVEKESDFTSVIEQNWQEWFQSNLPKNVKQVKVIDKEEAEEIEAFSLSKDKDPAKYAQSLYLKIEVVIRSLDFNQEVGKYDFEFQVSGLVMDIKDNKVLKTFVEKVEQKSYENIKIENFNSVVANYLYRLPMGKFTELVQSFRQIGGNEQQVALTVENYKSMQQLNTLLEEISNKGIRYGLKYSLASFAPGKAEYLITMNTGAGELGALFEDYKKRQEFQMFENASGISIKLKE